MNENDRELADGLRALAAAEPDGAPSRLEQSLVLEFRKQVRRRRLIARGSASAIGMLLAAAAVLIAFRVQAPSTRLLDTQATAQEQRTDEIQTDSVLGTVHVDEVASGFYPLPQAEALPAAETVMVVRVQMRMASLRLIGVPVNQQQSEEPIQADVLLGQDGLARGVRLIQ